MEESTFALVRYAMKFRIPSITYFLIAMSRLLLLSFGRQGVTYLGERDCGWITYLGLLNSYPVDRDVTLSEALLSYDKWLGKKGIKNTNFTVVTWSNWDCWVMLESECRYKKIRKPSYFNRWINLKVSFQEVFGGLRCNLKEVIEMVSLTWLGRAHCGLDDAKNTTRLLMVLLCRGIRFSITNSLTLYDNDHTLISKHSPPHQPHTQKDLRGPQSLYNPCCFCGIKSSVGFVRNPSTKQGNFFFWCGNWAAARGCGCCYFQWVAS